MNSNGLLKKLAELHSDLSLSKKELRSIVKDVIGIVDDEVKAGNAVNVFGHSYRLLERKPRQFHNPRTGEVSMSGAHQFITLKKRVS